MQRPGVRLTRQELYEKMWSRPAIALAEEFGISGRGLGKICARFSIPVPRRGYWAKLAVGKRVTKVPLLPADLPSEILIQPSPESPLSALADEVKVEVTTVLENRAEIRVPETLRNPHPIVRQWLEGKRERRKIDQLRGVRSEPSLNETERRKLRILSAIFTAVEKIGHAVKENQNQAYFDIEGHRLDYKVSERFKQVQIQLTDEERRQSWNPAIATQTDLEATGELCFEITTYISEPIRKRWRDGKRKTLDEQLGEVIAGLIRAAAVAKEEERVRAEKERQWQEKERQRQEQERIRRIDAVRWRHLCEKATLSRQAFIVRGLIDDLENRAKQASHNHELDQQASDWISWARKRTDAADPALTPIDKLIAENTSLNEWSYRDL